MTKEKDFSPEEWTLLGLAGAFNGEEHRWSLRKHGDLWQVIRRTGKPNEIEVKAEFKTNGEAHEVLTTMSDIAAAKAFLVEFKRILEEE